MLEEENPEFVSIKRDDFWRQASEWVENYKDYFSCVFLQAPGQFWLQNHPYQRPFPSEFPKIAGFDLFGTLIKTKSGRKVPKSSTDWEPLYGEDTLEHLRELDMRRYFIVIFSNEPGVDDYLVDQTNLENLYRNI